MSLKGDHSIDMGKMIEMSADSLENLYIEE